MVRLTAPAVSNERVSAKGTNSLSPFGFFRPEPPTPNYLSHGYTAHNLKLLSCVYPLSLSLLDFTPHKFYAVRGSDSRIPYGADVHLAILN